MRFLPLAIALAGVVNPGFAQRPDPPAIVTVGTATARRGEVAFGAILVPAGVDSGYSIPVAVVHGSRPGPVLTLVAGSHGTEYASIIALAQLIGRLDPKRIAGTVIVLPLVNVASFEQKVPHLNPIDRKNMNRFYPGNPNGTQTERASYLITKEVVEQSDHLIDLHGGDLDESLRPYSYWTVTGNAAQDSVSKAMVLAFGLDHIIISTERPRDPAASRYLENTATTRGKPSITVEAGYAGTVMPADVDALINGCLNVMGLLKMIERPVRPVARPIWIGKLVTVTSDSSGIFYPAAERDQRVAAGARLGYVTDYLGRKLFDVTAPEAGLILYLNALPTIVKGGTIASLGVSAKAP
ncbi:MAG TPA: succinylglutamate desuccinylase/aspartoacylase family protein [Gemmatimonadales bacterium]|nr:succinylglutamate desuccinylase/aspartoacylase family protein [Gemmatimonadales bacterium]